MSVCLKTGEQGPLRVACSSSRAPTDFFLCQARANGHKTLPHLPYDSVCCTAVMLFCSPLVRVVPRRAERGGTGKLGGKKYPVGQNAASFSASTAVAVPPSFAGVGSELAGKLLSRARPKRRNILAANAVELRINNSI